MMASIWLSEVFENRFRTRKLNKNHVSKLVMSLIDFIPSIIHTEYAIKVYVMRDWNINFKCWFKYKMCYGNLSESLHNFLEEFWGVIKKLTKLFFLTKIFFTTFVSAGNNTDNRKDHDLSQIAGSHKLEWFSDRCIFHLKIFPSFETSVSNKFRK